MAASSLKKKPNRRHATAALSAKRRVDVAAIKRELRAVLDQLQG